jgi:hypothetical protein
MIKVDSSFETRRACLLTRWAPNLGYLPFLDQVYTADSESAESLIADTFELTEATTRRMQNSSQLFHLKLVHNHVVGGNDNVASS